MQNSFLLVGNRKKWGSIEDILKRYKEEYDYPVADDLKDDSYKIIRTDLLAKDPIRKAEGDVLKRSLIRHDSHKLAETIMKLV